MLSSNSDKMRTWPIILFLVFLLGFLSNSLLSIAQNAEIPFSIGKTTERYSPSDRIPENNIEVYDDKIVINLKDASWASYADTNSMDPILDKGTNGIELKPNSESQLKIGDIISYKSGSGLIVHRITKTGYDKEGWYAVTKGDNNAVEDPAKVRFSQINGVLVALIY
mgnify:CR=1 FL=1